MGDVSSEKKHVLVVSGEPRVLAEIKMRLMPHFDVGIAAENAAAVSALEKYNAMAVVICIGESLAIALLDFGQIFKCAKTKGIPVIFLAESDDADDETAAFEEGADDYVLRRRGGAEALSSRLNLRIRAGEKEKLLSGNGGLPQTPAVKPEEILYGKTILVVDDVEINREIMAAIFCEIDGLTLAFAVNGKDAVEKFSKNPEDYSLILMDVQMPEMDGMEATRIIRGLNDKNAREIPIIALTASVGQEGTAQCLEAGMNDFIEKPPDYGKLIHMVAKYCL